MPNENENTGTETSQVNANADPISNEIDPRLNSTYGEVLPDALNELMGLGEDSEVGEPNPQTSTDGVANTPEGQQGQPVQPGTQTQTTPAAQSPAVDPGIAAMQDSLNQLVTLAKQGGQKPKQEGNESADPFSVEPQFDFTPSPQIINMLASEDPNERTQALAAVCNGVAVSVYKQTMQQISQAWKDLPNMIQGNINTAQVAQRVYTDFYSKNKDLDSDALRPVVQRVGQALMQEMLARGVTPTWNEQFANIVAQKTRELLKMPAASATPPGQPATQAAPATFGGSGGGGADKANRFRKKANSQQEFMDEL